MSAFHSLQLLLLLIFSMETAQETLNNFDIDIIDEDSVSKHMADALKPYSTNGKGTLFVGFLGYANPSNEKYNGECCDATDNQNHCDDYCELMFDVRVIGLDSSSGNWKRPSEEPINNDDVILFPSAYEGVINPLTFDFKEWPGNVTIEIKVSDRDDDGEKVQEEPVDTFTFHFGHTGSSVDYIYLNHTGERQTNHSELRMVFRYECEKFYYGADCMTDCLKEENKDKEICPSSETLTGTTEPITDWISRITTEKSTRDKKCQNLNISNSNCSLSSMEITSTNSHSSEPLATTENEPLATTESFIGIDSTWLSEVSTESLNHVSSETTRATPSTDSKYSVSSESYFTDFSHTMTSKSDKVTVQQTQINTQNSINTKQTKSKTSSSTLLPLNSFSIYRTTRQRTSYLQISSPITSKPGNRSVKNISVSPIAPAERTSSSSKTTDSVLIPTTVLDGGGGGDNSGGNPMDYWPAIVGGVLGAVALIATAGVVLYFRKQRAKLKSTQEIYNVNPKQWTLQPPQENGTSYGMTEIALETEEV